MSRSLPEVQQLSNSADSKLSRLSKDRSIEKTFSRDAQRAGGWVVRLFLTVCTAALSYKLGPFGLRSLPAAGVGALLALAVLLGELRLRRAAPSGLLGGALGTVLRMFAALLVTLVVARTSESEPTKSFLEFAALFAFGYLGLVLGSGRGGELHPAASRANFLRTRFS
jgi:hypothetical protein